MSEQSTPILVQYAAESKELRVTDEAIRAETVLRLLNQANVSKTGSKAGTNTDDWAVEMEVEAIRLPKNANVFVRAGGELVEFFTATRGGYVLPDDYNIDVLNVGVPVRLTVESTDFEVLESSDGCIIQFDELTQVRLTRAVVPARGEPITTTTDIEDMMAAFSVLSESLRSLGPERSLPMMREPVRPVEVGNELSIPDDANPPASDITIRVPRTYSAVYSTAPLAYYLAAEMVPGDEDVPILEADGMTVAMGGRVETADRCVDKNTIGEAASLVLRHLFSFDCLIREATDETGMSEKAHTLLDELEAQEISIGANDLLETETLAGRTRKQLEYPIGICDGVVDWFASANVAPKPENAAAIPRLLEDFAEVQSPIRGGAKLSEGMREIVDEFFIDAGEGRIPRTRGMMATQPYLSMDPVPTVDEVAEGSGNIVSPIPGSHQQTILVGDIYPIWSARPLAGRYQPGTERTERSDPPADAVVIVVPDKSELDGTVRELYNGHGPSSIDATVVSDATVADVEAVLQEGCEFLHFVGHVDDEGLECRDGYLDIREVESSNVEAFFLNSCSSYEQGEALLRSGSAGGIVTTDQIMDGRALEISRVVVGLLAHGFSLGGALSLLRDDLEVAPRYMILGDWSHTVVSGKPAPQAVIIEGRGDTASEVSLRVRSYHGRGNKPGSVSQSVLLQALDESEAAYWFGPGTSEMVSVPVEKLASELGADSPPVFMNNDYYNGADVDVELLESLEDA